MKKFEIDRLLSLVANGDNDAFEKLYIQTKRGVYSFLYSYLHDSTESEDAMQTVYLKIKTNVSQYKSGTNASAWILQIAKNTALNQIRANNNYRKAQKTEESSEGDKTDVISLKNSLTEAMRKTLDDEEQRVLILHVVWSYKHKEIAEMLGCPVGTVTSKYKRAVDKMKKALKDDER